MPGFRDAILYFSMESYGDMYVKLGFQEKFLDDFDEPFRNHAAGPYNGESTTISAKFKMATLVYAILYFALDM